MKYSVFRESNSMNAECVLEIPDDVKVSDVQKFIYELENKYVFAENADGWTEDGIHWFDFALDEMEKIFGVKTCELACDVYY